MFVTVALVISRLLVAAVADDPCQLPTGYGSEIRFVNKTSKFIITKLDAPNGIDFDLRLVYEWNVETPEGYMFDGFLYKPSDQEQSSIMEPSSLYDNSYYYEYSGDYYGKADCDKTLWAVASNGTSVECELPCARFFPTECYSMELCDRLTEGYISLPKERNRLEIAAEFGRAYGMTILVYRRGQVAKQFDWLQNGDGNEIIKFCNEELISNQEIDIHTAKKFCDEKQIITASQCPTGPPASLEQYDVKNDLIKNRATVIFRWKAPRDISPEVNAITQYQIHAHGGSVETTIIKPTMRRNDSYYYIKIRDVEFGKSNFIKVTPDVNMEDCGLTCPHGNFIRRDYTIPDIDACSKEFRFCDVNANCQDLKSDAKSSALCSCPLGYEGNGIAESFAGGTGCKDFDACSPSLNKSFCDPNAICKDLPPPSLEASCSCSFGYVGNGFRGSNGTGCMDFDACSLPQNKSKCDPNASCEDRPPPSKEATCSCRTSYYGDGYKSGSGCTKLFRVILLAVAVPISLVVIAFSILFIRRFRFSKNGTKALSRFIVQNDVKYLAPTSVVRSTKTNFNSSGVFGKKYEIDRKRIQLKDVLGRGNFGVVHKALLRINTESKVVAVKTTIQPHLEDMEREFLAEIALITSVGDHENVMSMIGCCTAGDSITYLVTQFMKYGDLQHFLWDAREESNRLRDPVYQLTENSIYDIGMQVARGMEHLSGLRIIHGDIAARNILVDEGLRCKISDFGLANDVYRYGVIRGAREKRVPIKWISPERMQAGRVPITWRSDVWSYGILLFESITLGSTPFSGVSQDGLLDKLQSGYRMSRPSSCSSFLYGVMLSCWEWTPSKRPSFKDLKQLMQVAISSQQEPKYINQYDMIDIANKQQVD